MGKQHRTIDQELWGCWSQRSWWNSSEHVYSPNEAVRRTDRLQQNNTVIRTHSNQTVT